MNTESSRHRRVLQAYCLKSATCILYLRTAVRAASRSDSGGLPVTRLHEEGSDTGKPVVAGGVRRWRRGPKVAAVVAIALLLAACGGSSDKSTGSSGNMQIRLALNNTSASLPAVIAEKQGFFTKYGLEVTSTVLVDITKISPALGHQFDIGFGVQPIVIRAWTQGIKIVMVSGNELTTQEQPELLIVARPDADISSPADLKGKTLAAPTLTGNLHLGTLYWLKEQGIDPSSVNSVQVVTPSMIDQLKAGIIDAAEIQQPFATLATEQGLVEVGYPLSVVGEPAQLSIWTASESWAKLHLKEIAAFKQALDDANAFIESQPDQAKAILADFTKLPKDLVNKAPLPVFTTDTGVANLEQWDKVLRSVGDFTAKVNYKDLIVTSP